MNYVLVFILLTASDPVDIKTGIVGEYVTMAECFEKREQMVEFMGRPIRGYQFICVRKKNDPR